MLGERGLRLSWRLADGSLLSLLANLGAKPGEPARPPPGKVIYATHRHDARCHRTLVGDLVPGRGRTEPMPAPPPRATYRLQLRGGIDFAKRRGPGALSRQAAGSAISICRRRSRGPGIDPRLRRGRSEPARPSARRRARLHGAAPRRSSGTGSACCSTSCPTTWASAATMPGGGTCSSTATPAASPAFSTSISRPIRDGKLVLPVLGGPLDAAIERGELRVVLDDAAGRAAPGLFGGALPVRAAIRVAPVRDLAGRPALPAGPVAGGQHAAATTGGSSTSTSSPACAWSVRRCSRPAIS